jgi:hypothetical protein
MRYGGWRHTSTSGPLSPWPEMLWECPERGVHRQLRAYRRPVPVIPRKSSKMTTPGFSAEVSLRTGTGPYRQRSVAEAAPPEEVRLAQDIPIHGNYCGPGHSGTGPPVDAVDQVCCRHDKCYCARGYLDCSCDRELIVNMPAAIADSSASAAAKGAAILAFFAADPLCFCHRWCFPFVGCSDAPVAVPGIPGPLKLCPPPYI